MNALARMGAVAALVSSLVAASTASAAAVGASGPVRYATRAGTFQAAFHARPVTGTETNPSLAFTTVSRLAIGPVISVTYRHGSPGPNSPYWDESVDLVRLKAGNQVAAVSLLSAKLGFRFVDFGGARAAPVSLLSPLYSPDLGVGELVVTVTGMYEVTADEQPSAARAFVASFAAPGFAGARPVPLGQVAEVTGYERVSVTNSSSGPVLVQLSTRRSDALAAVIDSLPAGPATDCHEDELLYGVVFGPSLGAPASYEADGHRCMGAVLLTEGAWALSPDETSAAACSMRWPRCSPPVRRGPWTARGATHPEKAQTAPSRDASSGWAGRHRAPRSGSPALSSRTKPSGPTPT